MILKDFLSLSYLIKTQVVYIYNYNNQNFVFLALQIMVPDLEILNNS